MQQLSIAERYALAFIDAASDLNISLEKIEAELVFLAKLWNENDLLKKLFLNPIISRQEKKDISKTIIKEIQFSEHSQHFLFILIDKNRISLLPLITNIFSEKMAKKNKTATAIVRSSITLSEEQQKRIKNKLIKLFNKNHIELKNETDPSLLGGIVITVGSERIDATVNHSLNELKREL